MFVTLERVQPIRVALSGLQLFSALLLVPGAWGCPCSEMKMPNAAPPGTSVEAGLAFSHTCAYGKQFTTAVASAKHFCQKYKREHPQARNLAVVSDIDETLLDNRPYIAQHRRDFHWPDLIREANSPSLKRTAAFLQWARKNGFAILLITGRTEDFRSFTVENLVRNGTSYDALYMRAKDDDGPDETYKAGVRKTIEDTGFQVVINIGDQVSDLYGGHALDCEKLPNRMYFIQ